MNAFVEDMVTALVPPRFVDNGDGTITDNQTGLMWEKKDDNSVGGIHDMDNSYTWSTGEPWEPDGTAFTVFLNTLNAKCDGDESTSCTTDGDCAGIGNGLCGHAGYRDWRIPEVNQDGGAEELDSLIDLAESNPKIFSDFKTPCTPSCTVTVCSCCAALIYWSSTTSVGAPHYALAVIFFGEFAGTGSASKLDSQQVRAVRSPLLPSPSAAFLDATSGVLD